MAGMDAFEGRNVLITGAADGIGAALAAALEAAGASVFLADINAEKLAATAERLGCPSAVCDVTDEAAVEAVVEQAWEALGSVDLLCANAGVIVPGSILDLPRSEFDFCFGVNVHGVLNAVRPQVRKLRESGRTGTFLLTGSEHSLSMPSYLRPVPMHVYTMTKHSVLAIGEALRAELGPEGHGVSVLCPGPVQSGLAENSTAARPESLGDPAAIDFSKVDPDAVQELMAAYISSDAAAATALRGLRAGAFVIPTHAFQKDDVEARYRETIAGFDLVE
ncbi:MAG: SDR family oxidoreductase [bacterium]|nr:SDR family oxidoreductase [bacterium]